MNIEMVRYGFAFLAQKLKPIKLLINVNLILNLSFFRLVLLWIVLSHQMPLRSGPVGSTRFHSHFHVQYIRANRARNILEPGAGPAASGPSSTSRWSCMHIDIPPKSNHADNAGDLCDDH